jgi:phosphatidylinositol-4-phosphate 3-kinase
MNVACELGSGQVSDYVLRVHGLDEYLETETTLSDYEYVHQCIKLEKDIELSLVHINDLKRPLARTVSII